MSKGGWRLCNSRLHLVGSFAQKCDKRYKRETDKNAGDLTEVFQYNCNVHVDDHQKRYDQVCDKEQYSHSCVAAVAVRFHFRRGIITVRWANHHTSQYSVPTS